jgi:multimeric flavodoxin WrbA
MEVKVLGICGSPVKGGNTEALLREAFSRNRSEGVDFRVLTTAGREITDCLHCNWCLKKQEGAKRCAVEDDMAEIYPLVEESDAVILATPVYFGRLSGRLAALIDRMRVYVHGNISRGMLRNKVGGSIAVSWFRSAGLEMTHLTIHQFFHAVNMVVASPDVGLQGGSAFSSLEGKGLRREGDRLLVLRDDFGVASAVSTVARAVELARLLKAPAGQAADPP